MAPKKSKSLFSGAKEAIKEFGKNLTTSRERRVRQRSEKKRAAGGGGALTIPGRASTCVDTRREPSDSEMELDEQGYASDAGVAMDVEHSSHSEGEEEEYHGPPGYPALMPPPIQYSTPVYGDPMMEAGSSHGVGAEYMGMGQPGSSQYGYMPPHQPDPVWEQPHTPIYEPQNQWQGTRGWEQAAASNMTEEQMRERNLAYVPYMNEAAAGGPDDPEFFRSWPGHVSYHIYQGKERKSLDYCKRVAATKGWKVEAGSPFELAARHAGLAHIPPLMYERLNEPLLTAFIERWNPETNSFHLPIGEMSIALHEVRAELGIGMQGASMGLTMGEYIVSHKTLMGKKFKVAGDALGVPHERGGCDWNKLMAKAISGDGMDEATQGSAYVLHILGTCLFPDKSGNKIFYGYWDFVKDWNTMGSYSWASGVLAYMFRHLGKATRWDCRKVSLCFTLLQSWIYAHFPKFRPAEDPDWDGEIPFCRRWAPESQRNTNRQYRQELDKLLDVDVDWTPYGRWLDFEDPQLAPSTFEGLISFGDISEPYMPGRFKRQFGRVQTIPGPIIAPTKFHRGPKVKAYLVEHPLNQWAWSSTATHQWRLRDFGLPVDDGTETVPGYMQWFLTRTHPFVEPPRVDEYRNVINRTLAKLGPYEYADPNMFYDMRGAVGDAIKDMRPYGMPSGYYHHQDYM